MRKTDQKTTHALPDDYVGPLSRKKKHIIIVAILITGKKPILSLPH